MARSICWIVCGVAAALFMCFFAEPARASQTSEETQDNILYRSGWTEEDGLWKYRSKNGEFLKDQWLWDQDNWYYLDSRGNIARGWTEIEGTRYFFLPTGEMVSGWCLDWDTHSWYYYDSGHTMHKGWLKYKGAWYWLDEKGEMVSGGYRTIGGVRYYFFNDGQLASNQYVGFRYYGEQGAEDPEHDVKLVGEGKVYQEDRDMVADALYLYPRKWIASFVTSGWSIQYYTEKSFFEAPDTDQGVYYKYYDLDTKYKKLKICRSDALTRAFGEYVAYALGYLEEGNQTMQKLRSEQVNLDDLLEIPDYYDSSDAFYFAALCEAYFDSEKRRQMETLSPATCQVLRRVLDGTQQV